MSKNDWIDKLRDRLADYEEPVGDDLWLRIEQEQAARGDKRRILPMWQRISMAAAVAAIAVGGAYVYLAPPTATTRVETKRLATTSHPQSRSLQSLDARSLSQLSSSPQDSKSPQGSKSPQKTKAMQETDLLASAEYAAPQLAMASVEATESCPLPTTASATGQERNEEEERSTCNISTYNNGGDGELALCRNSRHPATAWSINLYGENGGVGNHSSASQTAILLGSGEGISSAEALGTYCAERTREEKHHSQPVSLGLQVGVALSPRLMVSTGLVYTWASSEFTSTLGNANSSTTQTLHYVGVPLGIGVQVWRAGKWRTYLATGGEVDFNVKNHTECDGSDIEASRDKPQWSVHAAAGLQYDVAPQVGVYLEPGAKYYFDNGSYVENIFKERKLNFNVQLGVRWNVGR